jgi:hypothetical protein
MKPLLLLGVFICFLSAGCMTTMVLDEAKREPLPLEQLAKDPVTGEVEKPPVYPRPAYFLLLPVSVPLDIAASPVYLMMLLTFPDC